MTDIATTTDPRQALAELEARVIEGDETVTAAALQKATAAADFATLQQAAAERRAATAAALQREADAAAFRRDLAVQARQLADVQAAYGSVVDALRALNERIAGWQQERSQMVALASSHGLSDEVDSTLADLGRTDWVATIADEALGRFQTGSERITVGGGLLGAAPTFHALHAPQRREAVIAERVARLTETAARQAEREADRRRLAEADEAAARQAQVAMRQREQADGVS